MRFATLADQAHNAPRGGNLEAVAACAC